MGTGNRIVEALREDFLRGKRHVVIYSLLILLILFAGAVGFGLAGTNASGWTVFVFCLAAIIALQATYVITIIVGH
jgi:fatty acid desaturase